MMCVCYSYYKATPYYMYIKKSVNRFPQNFTSQRKFKKKQKNKCWSQMKPKKWK